MSAELHRDDAWQAVQYVLGELSAHAAARFEARLAEDAALCQHVADASLLVATTKAAAPVFTAPVDVVRPAGGMRAAASRSRWAAVAAVAASALCLMLSIVPRDDRSTQPGETSSAAKLLSLWRGQGDALACDADCDGIDDYAEWSSDHVPGWMIAAVSLERRQRTPGEQPSPGRPEEEWEDN
jgi:hypothetical protein